MIHVLTSLSSSLIDDVLSWGSMAAMTGNGEYIAGGQDFTADKRSLWEDGIVARATRATCIMQADYTIRVTI